MGCLASLHEKIKQLQAEVTRLEKEQATDSEGNMVFKIPARTAQELSEWCQEHDNLVHGMNHNGTLGGRYEYIFRPTTLGTIGTIRCKGCNEEYQFAAIRSFMQ